jgi:hypothetical protein
MTRRQLYKLLSEWAFGRLTLDRLAEQLGIAITNPDGFPFK